MVTPHPQCSGIWRWAFGKWSGGQGGTHVNRIDTLLRGDPENSLGTSTWGPVSEPTPDMAGLRLAASRTVRSECLFFRRHPAYSLLLQQPEPLQCHEPLKSTTQEGWALRCQGRGHLNKRQQPGGRWRVMLGGKPWVCSSWGRRKDRSRPTRGAPGATSALPPRAVNIPPSSEYNGTICTFVSVWVSVYFLSRNL